MNKTRNTRNAASKDNAQRFPSLLHNELHNASDSSQTMYLVRCDDDIKRLFMLSSYSLKLF